MKIVKNLTLAVVLATMGASLARAEFIIQYTPLPSSDVTTYSITIAGNVINQLNLTETQNDPNLNPFLMLTGPI